MMNWKDKFPKEDYEHYMPNDIPREEEKSWMTQFFNDLEWAKEFMENFEKKESKSAEINRTRQKNYF